MRLIDADALNKKLCKTTIFIKDGEMFQRMINDAPTIEPSGDLISRQGVMEAVNKWDKFGCMPDGRIAPFRELTEPEQYVPYVKFDDVITAIKYYPSAETPTVSEKHQLSVETPTNTPTDLISRQDAILAITGEPPEAHYPSWYAERIKSLPSVPDSRQRGEWIFKPKDAIELMFTKPKCSECGFESADGGNFVATAEQI